MKAPYKWDMRDLEEARRMPQIRQQIIEEIAAALRAGVPVDLICDGKVVAHIDPPR